MERENTGKAQNLQNSSDDIIDPATEDKQDDIIEILGEVQASPTENTVLDRLKDLLTDIVLSSGTNNIGNVNLLNIADSIIDPATEGKQDSIISILGEVQASPTENTVLDRLKDIFTRQADDSQKTQITDGTEDVAVTTDSALLTAEFGLEIARGNISGMKLFSIPGRKNNLSTSVLDDLTQVPSTTVLGSPGGIQLEIVSSSDEDSDTGGIVAQGSGARTIDIFYLDTAGAEQKETITMDGTNPVDTVATDIDFVQWMHTASVGGNANGTAVGNISLRTTDAATTFEYIAAGGNQSLSGRYKVPTGKTGYVTGWQVSGIAQRIDVRLRATVHRSNRELLPGIFLFQDIAVLKDSTTGWIQFVVPLKMPAGAIIKMSGISENASGDAGGQFDILLVDD